MERRRRTCEWGMVEKMTEVVDGGECEGLEG